MSNENQTLLHYDFGYALFAWLISRTFSANEHYFSLTANQPTVLSAMAYQPSEHDKEGCGGLVAVPVLGF